MRWIVVVAAAAALVLGAGCKRDDGAPTASDKDQLIAATRTYDDLVHAMNSAAIAQLFTPDGTIENGGKLMATGPVEIARFLGTFEGKVKVDSTATTVESVHIDGDKALVDGHYEQTVHEIASNQVISVAGTYKAEWVRDGSAWRIHHMRTFASDK